MTYTPPVLSLCPKSLHVFLRLLPPDRISRMPGQVTVHADMGDAVWLERGGRWVTAAPGFDTARRFSSTGRVQ